MIDRAHWIRPNHGVSFPRRWIYMATIVDSHPTVSGSVETWAGAVTAHRGVSHRQTGTRGLVWADHDTPAALWAWIVERTERRSRLVIVAHDVGRLLRITNALPSMVGLGWECTGIRLDSGSCYVSWKCGDRTLIMVDLAAWIAEPLGTLADLAQGYDVGDRQAPAWRTGRRRRCADTVQLIATVWEHLMTWCETEDLGNWHPTGAGQAWAAWRHRFMDVPVLCHGEETVRADERASVFCGRTEAYRHGHLPGPRWLELDFERAYVAICRDAWLPTKHMWSTHRVSVDRMMAAPATYRYLVDATVTLDRPSVPYRDQQGICWPIGTFRTRVWHDELRLAVEDGARVVVHHAHVYRTSQVLAQWAAWCDDVLDGRIDTAGPLERRAVKHWGRALVGRFGAQWSSWEPWGDPLDDHVGVTRLVDRDTGISCRLLAAGGPLRIEGPRTDGTNTAPSLMSAVMSEARIRLHETIRAAGDDAVAHCDTDGLIVQPAAARRAIRGSRPGLRVKAVWTDLTVLGPRQLHGDRGVHIAGLVNGAQVLADGTAHGAVVQGVGTALAHGAPDRVVVTSRVWNIAGRDLRRHGGSSGRTSPVVIVDGVRAPWPVDSVS